MKEDFFFFSKKGEIWNCAGTHWNKQKKYTIVKIEGLHDEKWLLDNLLIQRRENGKKKNCFEGNIYDRSS